MKSVLCVTLLLAVNPSFARAADAVLPSLEWQANAQNVQQRVRDLVEFGKANGSDDAKLANAVGDLRDKAASRKLAPAWSKKTSWIEGSGNDQVYFGVGVFNGMTSNRHLAFAVAENRARVEIARLLKVTIVRKSEANGWRTVTTTTTATLANVVIVDWYAEGTTIYALATYTKPLALEPDAPWIP